MRAVDNLHWKMALPGRCVFRDKCELNCQVFVLKEGESLSTSSCLACGHLAAFHEQNVPNHQSAAANSSCLVTASSHPQNSSSGASSSASSSGKFGRVMTFEGFKQAKTSSAFRGKSKSKPKAAKVKPEDEKVTINIGLMNFDHRSMMLKPLWGKRLPLKIRSDASHKEILEGGLSKWKIFNKAMIEDDENYMLLYDNGNEALFMPGQTQEFFVLSKYREELGRDYRRIVLFLCTEKNYERNYAYHVLGKDPNYSSDEFGEEEEGSCHHNENAASPEKKRTKVLDDETAATHMSVEAGVSHGCTCMGETEVPLDRPGTSTSPRHAPYETPDVCLYESGPNSREFPQEFLWEADFDTGIGEEELIKAATARSLEVQSQSKEETDLETLAQKYQVEQAKPETCTIIVLRKKIMQTCAMAIQKETFAICEMDTKKKVSFVDDEVDSSENLHESDHRKRSRAISRVSMDSDDSREAEDQLSRAESMVSLAAADKLHHLILEGNQEAAIKLINKGNDTNKQDRSGKTPLHTAILSKQYNIVDKLLRFGADVTICDDTGDTPLHTAIHVGSEKLVMTLIHQGNCDVEALGRNSATPLHLAAEMDNDTICKILVENRAGLIPLDADKMTPVSRAMERGAVKSAKYLLEITKKTLGSVEDLMYNVDLDGSSLLHLAVNSCVLGVVELCVEYGARIRQPRKTDKITAFHMACEQGSMPIVEFLVSKDPAVCRITLVDSEGRTPLHLAAGKNQVQVVEFLLENGATLDPRDDERRTPLFMAARYNAANVVQLLMDRGADVTIRDTSLRSMLHAAVGDVKSMEALLQSPAAVALITEKDDEGFSPVHYAAKSGDIKNIKLFVARNRASSSVLSKGLDTPIHVAARYGWTETVEALMDNQNSKIINMQNEHGKTALHFACSEGYEYTAEALLRLGAVIERDQTERTPLHFAAHKGALGCCKLMVDKFEDHINDVDKSKNTAMHLAASNGHAAVLNFLLSSKNAQILKNSNQENILDIATRTDQREVAAVIVKHERWDEALRNCSTALCPLMEKIIIKMPEVAVSLLDQCVEEKGDPSSENYMVKYDLNLIQGHYPGEDLKPDKSSLQLIETMAQYRRERCLTHPVSFVLLNTKWKKYGWLTFAVNMFSYLCFIIPLTALAVYERAEEAYLCGHITSIADEYGCTFKDLTAQLLSVTVVVSSVLLLIKHIFSLIRKRMAYVRNFLNIFEWICYIAAIVFVIPPCDCKLGSKLQAGAVALFFGWMNLILYFRRLSSYGQYVIMLTTMFVTLVKVLVLWMLFIMAFGTTFYMIMDEAVFSGRIGYSLFSMFVMTMGELNYQDDFMPWEKLSFATLTNVLFIVLVLGMPIIMMNMLIGLAVGDIDKIQQNALMDRYVLQVQLLLDIERSLPMFILKRVQVQTYSEYPNTFQNFKTKVVDLFVSFGKAEADEVEEEKEVSPGMQQIIGRLDQQEKRVDKMYNMLKEQTEVIKELNQMYQVKEDGDKEEKKEEQTKTPRLQLFGF